jgi:spore germination protein YaaH
MNGTIRYTIRPYDTIWMLAQVFNTTVDSIMELNPGIDPRNLLVGQVVTLSPGLQRYPSYIEEGEGTLEDMELDTYEQLMNRFRLLWEQHATWTRMAIMALVHNLPETDLILQRLLRNPQDFAETLRMFYGDEAAKNFADLLTAHLTIATEVVKAAMAGDNTAYSNALQRWYQNADQIAALLASINPNWDQDDWSAMLHEHLDLLGASVADMISQNYQAAVDGFDEIEAQALEMADVMADGIAEQFPD